MGGGWGCCTLYSWRKGDNKVAISNGVAAGLEVSVE